MLFALPVWPLALIILSLCLTLSSNEEENEARGNPANNLVSSAALGVLVGGIVVYGFILGPWKGAVAAVAYLALGYFILAVKLRHWGIHFFETASHVIPLLYYPFWCVIKAPNIWASARDLEQSGIPDARRERQHVALGLAGLVGLSVTIPIMFWTWDGRWAFAVAIFAYLYVLTTMAHFDNERENEDEPLSSQYR